MSGLRVLLNMSNCKRSYWVISIAKSIFNLQHYHVHTMKKEKKAWWKILVFEKKWKRKHRRKTSTFEWCMPSSNTHKITTSNFMFWGKIVGKTYIGKWTLSLLSTTIIQYQYQPNSYLLIYQNIYSLNDKSYIWSLIKKIL